MPNNTSPRSSSSSRFGKSGTVTAAEFESLTTMVRQYGARTVASKVAEICSNKAARLTHEWNGSGVASAYNSVASRINSAVGSNGSRSISTDMFTSLTGMVATYGPEVIVQKVAKIAGRNGSSADATQLKNIFPRSSTRAA